MLLSSGIPGLDSILHGGFAAHHPYLLKGKPGTGKTSLALQFLSEGARNGERTIYVSFSESRRELEVVSSSHGWPLERIDVLELAADISRRAISGSSIFHSADVDLPEVMAKIQHRVEEIKPTRLAIDSLTELRNMAESQRQYRRAIFQLKLNLEEAGVTTLFVGERDLEVRTEAESLVHGVIHLEMDTPVYGPTRRRLEVTKLRGQSYETGFHDFTIARGGLEVFPRIRPKAYARRLGSGQPVASGIQSLDDLLGGGLERGTTSLFVGPSGTGKSSIVMQYAIAAARRGEKAVLYAFDEDVETIKRRAHGMELPLADYLENGQIAVRTVDTAELSPGQFAHLVRMDVEEGDVAFVAIDSLNGYLHAMPDERALIPNLHDLLMYLGSQGIVMMLVMTLKGLLRSDHRQSAHMSYLSDTILLLDYRERDGAIHRTITAAKHRTGAHDNRIREFRLGAGGIEVGAPIAERRRHLAQGSVPEEARHGRSNTQGADTDDL